MEESERMKIIITGGEGQLGRELVRQLSGRYQVYGLGKSQLDITRKDEVDNIVSLINPNVIIHTAAYTAVDQCETQIMKAFNINGLGTGYVANASSKVGARLIYISTDYVFDGNSKAEYQENVIPNPQSIYGMSKWLGEQLTINLCNGTVIRTSWLYGHGGKNFVNTLINLAYRDKEIRVVNDQIGSPTYVNDLAETIIRLLDKKNGIYHVTNSGYCSWYDFAKAIFIEKNFDHNKIKPISSENFGAIAQRPKFSVLGHNSLIREGINPLRHWKEALKDYIRKENFR
ncbi:dTDP-4-dehydrorhamnose reductase [Cytobacillus firmus]|uniref:dTDP-4-dehydrorhamnose reductase n=1 Tax=Bacillus sp. 22-7 TaxID=2709707 RepID=UPI00256FE3FB|nr:dTDP-4-dehydrorhamnose reductase [Bacillus sp. 22-7]